MAVDIGLLYMHAVRDHEAATCIDVVIWDDWEVLNHGADVPSLPKSHVAEDQHASWLARYRLYLKTQI
jgi:hypothetical protein